MCGRSILAALVHSSRLTGAWALAVTACSPQAPSFGAWCFLRQPQAKPTLTPIPSPRQTPEPLLPPASAEPSSPSYPLLQSLAGPSTLCPLPRRRLPGRVPGEAGRPGAGAACHCRHRPSCLSHASRILLGLLVFGRNASPRLPVSEGA